MISANEDALMCDMAETYRITDFRALPIKTAAALACGLSPDSRVKMSISGAKAKTDTILMAALVDRMSTLVWMQSKDGSRGVNRPASLLDEIYGEKKREITTFASGEEFDSARRRLIERCSNGD